MYIFWIYMIMDFNFILEYCHLKTFRENIKEKPLLNYNYLELTELKFNKWNNLFQTM